MPLRVLQLTDLHLLRDEEYKAAGIPTLQSFRDVLAFARQHHADVDHVIITGDVSNDGPPDSYSLARDMLGDWLPKLHVIPGNHDDRRTLRHTFPGNGADVANSMTFSFQSAGWRFIGLDSLDDGAVTGFVDVEQLAWLACELNAHRNEPTAVFIHHPPFSVNSVWLDRIGMRAPEPLNELLAASRQVKVVSAGHVHHEFEARAGTAALFTTPSTALQFTPGSSVPSFDSIPPGYRYFEFDGAAFRSRVLRLPELKYRPGAPD